MSRARRLVATAGGLGLAPVAPGTFGTLAGVGIAWALAQTGAFWLWTPVVAGALYALGRPIGDWAEAQGGGKDPGWFVLDEVIGYLVVVWWVAPPTLLTLVVAFLVFRFLDIVKPWPVRLAERVRGGDGILLDDVVAGLYGLLAMAALRLLLLEPAAWSAGGAA